MPGQQMQVDFQNNTLTHVLKVPFGQYKCSRAKFDENCRKGSGFTI